MEKATEKVIPGALIWRRLQSLMGFWLVIFLMQHLLINSQAAYFLGADGEGFIHSANSIRELPYLPVIEVLVLALPILIHGAWGIIYLRSAKYNSEKNNSGIVPSLPMYAKNHAYTWQRVTSYLLMIGLLAHIVHMRILKYPEEVIDNNKNYYTLSITEDPGLYTLSKRLDVDLKDNPLKKGEVVAVAKNFGTAELLMVRDAFKSPVLMLLYTVFVLAACFHGFNGLWTFLNSWGVTVSERSRNIFLKLSYGLMFLFSFLGLSAIYVTYWINLRH